MIKIRCLLLCVAASSVVVLGSQPVATLQRADTAKTPRTSIRAAEAEPVEPVVVHPAAAQTASTLSTTAPQRPAALTGTGMLEANIAGGIPGCICGYDTEGNNFCFDDLFCADVTACRSSTDCPQGYRCVANNCCPAPYDFGCFPECPDGSRCANPGTCSSGYHACANYLSSDLCQDATLMAVPSQIFGSTTAATIDGAPACNVTNDGPGVWYKVIGTGTTMTASTCSEFNTLPDSKISVYCAGCGALNCVAGNDDECPGFNTLLSTVPWCSERGVEYLILVHDYSATSGGGDFQLSVFDDGVACDTPPNCVAPPANDTCDQAAVIPSVPYATTFDNSTALSGESNGQ